MATLDNAAANAAPSRYILDGRYEVMEELLGSGGFCVVCRGQEVATGCEVAIKSYSAQFSRQAGSAFVVEDKFKHEIGVFKALAPTGEELDDALLHRAESVRFTLEAQDCLARHPQSDCFVALFAHSQNANGEPGPDVDGNYYTVLELAEYTLEEFIHASRKEGRAVSVEYVYEIVVAMLKSLAWLHVLGMVHLDVKPANFMYFQGRWKMIDMDGVQPSRCTVEVGAFYTPLYASPELAEAVLNDGAVQLSRAMDMWSFGVTVLDLLYGGAALHETQAQFQTQALFGDADEKEFFRFLADKSQPLDWASGLGLPPSEALECADLRNLLDGVLVKEPSRRTSASEALAHPFVGARWSSRQDARPVTPQSLPSGRPRQGTPRESPMATKQRSLVLKSTPGSDAGEKVDCQASMDVELGGSVPTVAEPGSVTKSDSARAVCCCRRRQAKRLAW